MPQSNMILHVDFPDWDNYSDPVKSLINFFMKDASVFYQGSYSGSALTSFSGNIRTKYRTVMYFSGDSDYLDLGDSIELDIIYSDSWNHRTPISTVNCLPSVTTTLIAKSSKLNILSFDFNNNEAIHVYSYLDQHVEPIDSINVTLTPKIGSTTNTDATAKIHSMTSSNPLVEVGINTSQLDFYSDYQLRTSSLYLDDGEGLFGFDVFYKIGVVPFSKKYPVNLPGTPDDTPLSVQAIVVSLLRNGAGDLEDGVLCIDTGTSYANNGYTFSIQNTGFKCGSFKDNTENPSTSRGKVPFSFIIPIRLYGTTNDYFVGLLYARMYKTDGTLVDPNIEDVAEQAGTTIKLYYPSFEGDPNPVVIDSDGRVTQNMSIISTDLDGGYVQSPDNE